MGFGDVAYVGDGQCRAAAEDPTAYERTYRVAGFAELAVGARAQYRARVGHRDGCTAVLQRAQVLLDANFGSGVAVGAAAQR